MSDIAEMFDDADIRPKVLVVDGSPNTGPMMREILAEQGFYVDVADNAGKALELLARGKYSCVVTEYELPDTDGIDFARKVRQTYGDVPIVMMSQSREAYWDGINVVRAVLRKPFPGYELVKTLRKYAPQPQAQQPQALH